MSAYTILQTLMIIFKLTGDIKYSWLIIFIPTYVLIFIYLIIFIGICLKIALKK